MKHSAYLRAVALVVLCLWAVACGGPAPQSAQQTTPAPQATKAGDGAAKVNDVGKKLPDNAAANEQQVLVVPFKQTDAKFADISANVYNRGGLSDLFGIPLTRLNKDFETIPGAAKSWKVSDDAKTWTFALREDLNWSDNTPLTADDFIATIRYMADPKSAYDFVWYFEEGNIKNFSAANQAKAKLEEIGVRQGANPKELVIETTTPTPYLPSLLLYYMPLQKKALEKSGPTYNSNPATAVSSGPFIVTEWTPTRWVAVANKNVPDDLKPYINKVIALAFENQIQAYQAGKIDRATPASPADLKIAIEDPVLSKDSSPDVGDFRTNYFFFDMSKAPYNNLKFRQALSHLLDRDSIGKSIAKAPAAKPAVSFLAPGFPGSNVDGLKDIQKYDIAMAKKLYEESGIKVASIKLQVRNEGNDSFNVIRRSIAQVFADEIKKQLGIATEVQIVEQKAFMDDLNAKPTKIDFGMISYGMDYLDQSNMLSVFKSNGRHNWNNAKYEEFLRTAGPLADKAKRDDLYRQAEKLLVEEAPAIWTHHETQVNLWRPYLAGKSFDPGKVNTAKGIAWPGFAALSLIAQDLYITDEVTKLRPTPPK